MDQLESELGVKVEKHEVWYNKENQELMGKYGRGLCGGVPFFYNTDNGKFICGAAPYEKLKQWAQK